MYQRRCGHCDPAPTVAMTILGGGVIVASGRDGCGIGETRHLLVILNDCLSATSLEWYGMPGQTLSTRCVPSKVEDVIHSL
jgi:hypothetical protein